jgi:hypothetical protein
MVSAAGHISRNGHACLQKIKPLDCTTDQAQGTLHNLGFPWAKANPADFILPKGLGKKAVDIVCIVSEQNFFAGGKSGLFHFDQPMGILIPYHLGNPGITINREPGGAIEPG